MFIYCNVYIAFENQAFRLVHLIPRISLLTQLKEDQALVMGSF